MQAYSEEKSMMILLLRSLFAVQLSCREQTLTKQGDFHELFSAHRTNPRTTKLPASELHKVLALGTSLLRITAQLCNCTTVGDLLLAAPLLLTRLAEVAKLAIDAIGTAHGVHECTWLAAAKVMA
eukprot:gnl/TRDRNA2_/TRDRNA2_40175_c1_seq1.p2 gnl/TRDRNA2_/TRDRNA2_40175_c1~~gnl/TRDRNA2_/TRDRNA2_40175_c1_seq1.p2  ORF type:complete len:125 (+),score=20.62 gnl/TRDRNA2_/TRDRNA2_40175_c1_seq1:284-658(+)